MLVDVTDGSSTLANERTHLAFLSHGVGACGRRPSESADPKGGPACGCPRKDNSITAKISWNNYAGLRTDRQCLKKVA